MNDKTENPAEIYLITDSEGDLVWCDTPAPGEGMREEDATRYVREDIYLALQAQVEQLEQLLVSSTDQNDLLLDEFVRVKLLTNNTEIHALCERAHVRMRQNVSVIDRNMMQEQKIISQKRDIEEMQCHIELLQSFLMQCKYRNPQIPMPDFIRTGQCLAEIKAQAVEAEYRDLLHVVANQYDGNDSSEWSIGANHVFRLFAKEVTKRANQLRQQAKGE